MQTELRDRIIRATIGNLVLGENLVEGDYDSHCIVKKLCGDRLYASQCNDEETWFFIQCGERYDIYIKQSSEWDNWDAYLIYPYSNMENIVIKYKKNFIDSDLIDVITDLGIASQSFDEKLEYFKQLHFSNESAISIISEVIKSGSITTIAFNGLIQELSHLELHSHPKYSAYELLALLCCKGSRKINRAAYHHKKIISIILSHAP